MKVHIRFIGRESKDGYGAFIADYMKRMTRWQVRQYGQEASRSRVSADVLKAAEAKFLLKTDTPQMLHVALDERGKSYTSQAFAHFMAQQEQSGRDLTFMIGGAHGLDKDLLKRADHKIAFGVQTWPHAMVRLMLTEQIYRAQQILQGHPYHK